MFLSFNVQFELKCELQKLKSDNTGCFEGVDFSPRSKIKIFIIHIHIYDINGKLNIVVTMIPIDELTPLQISLCNILDLHPFNR